jgi:hypothetical protein
MHQFSGNKKINVCQKPKKILEACLHKYKLFHNDVEYYGWGLES